MGLKGILYLPVLCLMAAGLVFQVLSSQYFDGAMSSNTHGTALPRQGTSVWTVDDDGAANFSSIQEAINSGSQGDTIYVYNGIYYENVVVNKTVLLVGENRNSTVIDGNHAGHVVQITASNVKITNFTVQNCGHSYHGIYVWNGSISNTISVNNMEGDIRGIVLQSSDGNVVSENMITGSDFGILILGSSKNTIYKNNITQNYYDGIQVSSSSNNTISENSITWSNHHGIRLLNSYNNELYHNNIANNFILANASSSYTNFWDNGVEGNYWGDYGNTLTDQDGIGNTPYEINVNNTDHYPLLGMFSSFTTPLGCSIDVISNSTVENFEYSEANTTIRMHASNTTNGQTHGFCRVRIPHAMMNETYQVTVDGVEPHYVNYTLYDDGENRWIYFSYEHSQLEIVIVPEFPSLIIPPSLTITTLLAVMLCKRK